MAIVDSEGILQPIAGDDDAGVDAIKGGDAAREAYRGCRAALESAQAAIAQQTVSPDAQPPDWSKIVAAATVVLASHSKDLGVCLRLCEALTRKAGAPGLRTGAELLLALVERYGGRLHPRPSDEEPDVRARAVHAAFSGERDSRGYLVQAIDSIVLFRNRDGRTFAAGAIRVIRGHSKTLDKAVQTAIEDGRDADRSKFAASLGGGTVADVRDAAQTMAPAEIAAIRADVLEARRLFERLADAFEGTELRSERHRLTGTSAVCDQLDVCLKLLDEFAPEAEPEAQSHEAQASSALVPSPSGGASGVGVVMSRASAIAQLEKISAYFRAIEPHSPVSYAIAEAARWARLPFPELLKTLAVRSGGSSIDGILKLLNAEPSTDGAGGTNRD